MEKYYIYRPNDAVNLADWELLGHEYPAGSYIAYDQNRAFIQRTNRAGKPALARWDGNPLVFSLRPLELAGGVFSGYYADGEREWWKNEPEPMPDEQRQRIRQGVAAHIRRAALAGETELPPDYMLAVADAMEK